jgi:hypothetical protein
MLPEKTSRRAAEASEVSCEMISNAMRLQVRLRQGGEALLRARPAPAMRPSVAGGEAKGAGQRR